MRVTSITLNTQRPTTANAKFQRGIFMPQLIEKADSVSFTARPPKLPPKERMVAYAQKLLKTKKLKPNQPIFVTADSKHVPFLRVLAEEAYKKGSGDITFKVVEPELVALKHKYNIIGDFDFKDAVIDEAQENNSLFLKFSDTNCPYERSGLSIKERNAQIASIKPRIPHEIQDKMMLDPVELFKTGLDIKEGQPVTIAGEREHLPAIVKLVEWLYAVNKSKLVSVSISELKEFDPDIAFYQHAREKLIGKHPKSFVKKYQELVEKKVARLFLQGDDPNRLSDVDSKRVAKHMVFGKTIDELHSIVSSNNPWLIYWAPTTKAAVNAYPELATKPMQALEKAVVEGRQITRYGTLQKHIENIEARAKTMNGLIKKGFTRLHFVSVDPQTKLPDGKTDFKIGVSTKSLFAGARMNMRKNGHKPIVNIPTEEVFTSPTNNSAEGKVSATMPLVLNGKVVEGIEMIFQKGKAIIVKATKNLEMLKEHIKANKNSDRIGEVAIVAGSPIAKLRRLFFETLIDENATCHIAIGDAYPDAVRGPGKLRTSADIQDMKKQKAYLKKLHINSSPSHNDFMIGGDNVYVYAENPKTGKRIQIVKDDKFLL